MSQLPRHNGILDSDPRLDARYLVHGVVSDGFIYNAAEDRMESGTPSNDGSQHGLTVINSKNSAGEVICNFNLDGDAGNGKLHALVVTAFGYKFIQSHRDANRYIYHAETQDSPDITIAQTTDYIYNDKAPVYGDGVEWRIVANNLEVLWYVNGALVTTVDARSVNQDVDVRFVAGASFSGMRNQAINSIIISSDSSLPLVPVLRQPAPSGNVAANNGPVIWESPNQRWFIDLTEWAGIASGVSNVIYDPASANSGPTPMTEDTDGSGSGDYYFESPAEQGSTWRLVVKESFRTANSLSLGETIRFDVDGVTGALGVDRVIKRDDDLHFRLEIDTHPAVNFGNRVNLLNTIDLDIHNADADGNLGLYTVGGPANMIANYEPFVNSIASLQDQLIPDSATFPILVDVDLKNIRTIKSIGSAADQGGNKTFNAVDVYSNTVPFSGSSLAQGTKVITALSLSNDTSPTQFFFEDTNFTTRYVRFVFLNSYLSAGNSTVRMPRRMILLSNGYQILETDGVDAAQFELSDGGAFAAFPVGGTFPSDDTTVRVVKCILPPGKLLQDGLTYYMRIRAKADLSD